MEDSNRYVPKWVYWFLAPIVAALAYCAYIHAMPGYILIIMLVCILLYAGVSSYYLYKSNQIKLIVALWIVLFVFVGTFIFNAFALNKLFGLE